MIVVFALCGIAVVAAVAVLLSRDVPLIGEDPITRRPFAWPPEGGLDGPAVVGVRFSPALRGYRMGEVDAVLRDCAAALADRDAQIEALTAVAPDAGPSVGAGADADQAPTDAGGVPLVGAHAGPGADPAAQPEAEPAAQPPGPTTDPSAASAGPLQGLDTAPPGAIGGVRTGLPDGAQSDGTASDGPASASPADGAGR